jgi:hypothetical protein
MDMPSFQESDISVTDAVSATPKERQLIEDGQFVEICLYDKYGNVAEFPPSREYVCVCNVRDPLFSRNDSSAPRRRLPQLRGANSEGFLKGAPMSSDAYRFSSLALQAFEAVEGSTGADGVLELVFNLVAAEVAEGAPRMREKLEVSVYSVDFRYSSDEARAAASRLVLERVRVRSGWEGLWPLSLLSRDLSVWLSPILLSVSLINFCQFSIAAFAG